VIKRISVSEAAQLIDDEAALIVDIRDPNAFNQGHISGAVRIDNDNIQTFLQHADKSKPLVVYCYHGNSSLPAAEVFNQQGFERSYSMDGGMSEWALTNKTVSE